MKTHREIWEAMASDPNFYALHALRADLPADEAARFDAIAEDFVTAYQTCFERGVAAFYAAGADRVSDELFDRACERFIDSAAEFAKLRRKHGVGWARLPEVHRQICECFEPD